MSLFNGTELREIYLTVPSARSRWERFLDLSGLVADSVPDYTVGVFDSDDSLIGTASLENDIIKYVAIHPDHRGEAIANTLISSILNYAAANGITEQVIFTKPEYESLFTNLSFHPIGRSENAVMLESSSHALKSYLAYLRQERQKHCKSDDKVGVIVMNTNPLTIGHLHLIEFAASQVDRLFIIPLADNPATAFSYESRRNALLGTAGRFNNVTVLKGSRYSISASTFPSYFIKERTLLTDTHISLDLNIFAHRIAPVLGAMVRFVGQEPSDPLTARYNELMKQILPEGGIQVVEIPRLADMAGAPVSASSVRRAIKEGGIYSAINNVAPEAIPAVLAKVACEALVRELELTPKPGLIDCNNNGAHTDMNAATMKRSIRALEPVFEELAAKAMDGSFPCAENLQPIGVRGERLMLDATGNINTHKGALFSLGIAVSAVAYLCSRSAVMPIELNPQQIGECIARIASSFNRPDDTNGAEVARKYKIPTAIDTASSGYQEALSAWITVNNPYRRLLTIISEMHDSNVYHRGGSEGAEFIMTEAKNILQQSELHDELLIKNLEDFDKECIVRNLSPGGCADILALTFFIESVTGCNDRNSETNKINNNNNLKN